MAIKKKCKIIIAIIICSIIFVALVSFIKLKTSYVFNIGTAVYKTINTTSAAFEFNYESNDIEKIDVEGEIEYSFEYLELLGNANVNKGRFVIEISKEKSTIAYYIESFEHWVTMDITEIASKILELLSSTEKTNFEDFPVKEFLKLVRIDDIIDISEYPNKLTKKFMIKFLNNNYVEDILNCTKEKEKNVTTYVLKPKMYELLRDFIETSKLDEEEKNRIIQDLEKNKEKLENIDLEASISIDEDGYITKLIYIRTENDEKQKIELELNNFNNIKIELEDELKQKLELE